MLSDPTAFLDAARSADDERSQRSDRRKELSERGERIFEETVTAASDPATQPSTFDVTKVAAARGVAVTEALTFDAWRPGAPAAMKTLDATLPAQPEDTGVRFHVLFGRKEQDDEKLVKDASTGKGMPATEEPPVLNAVALVIREHDGVTEAVFEVYQHRT
jgi:hypothetical protein